MILLAILEVRLREFFAHPYARIAGGVIFTIALIFVLWFDINAVEAQWPK